MATLTLANISLDVQISICIYLHPSDILALRKTCKAFQLSTRQRVVWVDALHRVCIDNSLFLPSFPISDMSDLEIEKAAMGPRRWIKFCGAYEKQHLNGHGVKLLPRATRVINAMKVDYSNTDLFIVPGGRYLVKSSPKDISVLDLGYTSSADCKLIASLEEDESNKCLVQATPDGMGLVILLYNEKKHSVYEIYPQSETPRLTQIAHVDFESTMDLYLLPGKVIWYDIHKKKIDFRVWDYRLPLNRSIIFSLDVDGAAVLATKTTVIVVCEEAVSIWAIPPQPPEFYDHSLTHMPPPLITVPFPDGTPEGHIWNSISSWYLGSSQPLYFDMVCEEFQLRKFQIMVEPDLSTASIHVIHSSEITADEYLGLSFERYRICEDTLVFCWVYEDSRYSEYKCGIYTGLTSPDSAHGISHGGPAGKMLLPCAEVDLGFRYLIYACPASGRFVRLDGRDIVAVLDLF